jgi:cytidyltransferase-like protein
MKIIILSGGFDPCHSGHISMINAAKELGDILIVGVNSDSWLQRKKVQAFMPWQERATIVGNLKAVDQVAQFNDDDGTACDLIEKVKASYPLAEIVFANGGDRTKENIPEMRVSGVEFIFGVGGENKMNSSSWILQEWKAPKTERQWGYYRNLFEVPGVKVKELTVDAGKSLSMQRHFERSEYWLVSEGQGQINTIVDGNLVVKDIKLHDEVKIPVTDWHQLVNHTNEPLRIVEIQYGTKCVEEDIERKPI